VVDDRLLWEAILREKLDSENVNLLWTGGWDSTFHLLQLLTVHHACVTPFYLIHPDRPSTGVELKTINAIRTSLFNEYPYTKELLQPGHYSSVSDIAPDPEITETFQSIIKERKIGSQYEWLARFCKQHALTDMQLGIHRDDKAHRVIGDLVSKADGYPYDVYRLDPRHRMKKEYILFGYFCFPIFNLTKRNMAAIAEDRGWTALMNMTWFCHRPGRDMKPCGRCKPCIYTIEEGLGWRLPTGSRIRYIIHNKLVWSVKSRAKRLVSRLKSRRGV
jgi:hypothetical protein